MERRTFVRGLGVGIALASVGGGLYVHSQRVVQRRDSDRIIGPWPELGMNANWLLPDLRNAHMEVVDRPHRGAEAQDIEAIRRMRRVRSFSVNTSSRRLRWPDPEEEGPCVLCVGDSVTFGWGVEDEESWPAQLAERLRDRSAQVHNAGVPGQPLAPMRNYLARFAPALRPDIILVARRMPPQEFPTPMGFIQLFTEAKKANPNARLGLVLPPVASFDPHGQANWSKEMPILRKHLPAVPILELTPRFAAAQKGMPGVRLNIVGQTHRVVDNQSGALILETPAPPQEMDDRVYALFEADPDLREPLFFDTGHPDATGLHLMAGLVADWIEEQGWLG